MKANFLNSNWKSFTRNSIDDSSTKVEIVGAEETPEGSVVTLRPNRFRPEAGVRARLRTALHETLDDVEALEGETKAASPDKNDQTEPSTRYTTHFTSKSPLGLPWMLIRYETCTSRTKGTFRKRHISICLVFLKTIFNLVHISFTTVQGLGLEYLGIKCSYWLV